MLPANSLVHVTIYQFDWGIRGCGTRSSPKPPAPWGHSSLLNGKTTRAIDPDSASHVFAIPAVGLSVPLEGRPRQRKEPVRLCAVCAVVHTHNTIAFHLPNTGKAGHYRWQCFVPCAAGFYYGFGGPMQTIGYMDGFIKTV